LSTGDNIYTAAKAGQNLDFGPESYLFFKADIKNLEQKNICETEIKKQVNEIDLYFVNYENERVCDYDKDKIEQLSKEHTLCCEGPPYNVALEKLEQTDPTGKEFELLTSFITIFARVSPYQKELIIEK